MTDSNVWSTDNTYTLTLHAKGNVTTKEYASPITVDQVKAANRELGVSNFTTYDDEDNMLNPESFPYTGNVVTKEYNAAK